MSTKLILCLAILLVSGGSGLAQQNPGNFALMATDLGTIGAGSGMISYEGSLEYPGDIKWFRFVVEAPTADITVFADLIEDLRLVIYDENQNFLDSGEGTLTMTAEAGTYFVRVDSADMEVGDYIIAISSLFESEPNECLSEGNDIGSLDGMIMVGGSIDPVADTDFFLFEVKPGSEGYAMISATPSVEDEEDFFYYDYSDVITLTLYEYDEIQGRYLPIDRSNYGIQADLAVGRYAIRVESDNMESTTGYSLAIAPLSCEDEPNDSPREALEMGVLTSGVELTDDGCILPEDDVDYYAFELNENMVVAIEISGGTDGDSYLYLYDEDKEEIDNDDDSGYGTWSKIEQVLEPGTYYIKVKSYGDGETFQYTMTITALDFECEDEPNDSPREALEMGTLTSDVELTNDGCILPEDDVDYYIFELNEDMTVAIETSGDDYGDSYLYLYDEELEEIDHDDDSGDGTWSKIEEELEPGTYYIKVKSYSSAATFQYTLTVGEGS